VERGAVGRLADERVVVDRTAADFGEAADRLDVILGVNSPELDVDGDWRFEDVEPQPVGGAHRSLGGDDSLGGVGMLGQVLARVVLERAGVADVDAYRHVATALAR
jgi:hypothetical protein